MSVPIAVTEDTPPDMLEGHMDLVVHLPNDTFLCYKAERSCAVMDLLVQIAAKAKLKPADYILQPLGNVSSQHENAALQHYENLEYKPNTPIGMLNTQVVRLIPKNDVKVTKVTKSYNLLRSGKSTGQLYFEPDFKNKVDDFNKLTGTSAVDVCNNPDFNNQYQIDSQVKSRSNYISSVLPPVLKSTTTDLAITPPGTTNRPNYTQPFEPTSRVQINLPLNQLHILRVKPHTLLQEIFDIVCDERNLPPHKYHFVYPDRHYKALNLRETLVTYGKNEISLVPKINYGLPSSEVTMRSHKDDKKINQRWSTIGITSLFKRKDKSSPKIIYGTRSLSSEDDKSVTSHSTVDLSVPTMRTSQVLGRANVTRSQSTVNIRGTSLWTDSHGNRNYSIINENEKPYRTRVGTVSNADCLSLVVGKESGVKAPLRKKRPAPQPPVSKVQSDVATVVVKSIHDSEMPITEMRQMEELHEIQESKVASNAMLTAHSRTSSDSSGYHEATSVLSDGGMLSGILYHNNYGQMPFTLPRRQKVGNRIQSMESTFKEESFRDVHLEMTSLANERTVPKIAPRKKRVAPIAPARGPLEATSPQNASPSFKEDLGRISPKNISTDIQNSYEESEIISPQDTSTNNLELISQSATRELKDIAPPASDFSLDGQLYQTDFSDDLELPKEKIQQHLFAQNNVIIETLKNDENTTDQQILAHSITSEDPPKLNINEPSVESPTSDHDAHEIMIHSTHDEPTTPATEISIASSQVKEMYPSSGFIPESNLLMYINTKRVSGEPYVTPINAVDETPAEISIRANPVDPTNHIRSAQSITYNDDYVCSPPIVLNSSPADVSKFPKFSIPLIADMQRIYLEQQDKLMENVIKKSQPTSMDVECSEIHTNISQKNVFETSETDDRCNKNVKARQSISSTASDPPLLTDIEEDHVIATPDFKMISKPNSTSPHRVDKFDLVQYEQKEQFTKDLSLPCKANEIIRENGGNKMELEYTTTLLDDNSTIAEERSDIKTNNVQEQIADPRVIKEEAPLEILKVMDLITKFNKHCTKVDNMSDQELKKRYTFTRVPEIKLSTWNERPKTTVFLKSDNDYKISTNMDKSMNERKEPKVILDNSTETVNVSDNGKYIIPPVIKSETTKTAATNRNSLSANMYRQISHVPVIKSSNHIKSVTDDKPLEFGQNTLRKTGLRRMIIDQDIRNMTISKQTEIINSEINKSKDILESKPHAVILPQKLKKTFASEDNVLAPLPIIKSAVLKKQSESTTSKYSNIQCTPADSNKSIDYRASLLDQIRSGNHIKSLKKIQRNYE